MTAEKYVNIRKAQEVKKAQKEKRAREILRELEELRPTNVEISMWALATILANQEMQQRG